MTAGSGIVVGIDPSLTSTGVAQLRWGKPWAFNTFGRTLQTRASFESRGDRMVYTLSRVLQNVPQDTELVVIEGMATAAAGKHLDADVYGLWWHVYTHLHARGTAIAVIAPLTLKVWATGKAAEKIDGVMHRTSKADMIDAARNQFPGYTIRNGDVADALHAASCGAAYLGHPLPFARRRDRFNVQSVRWPTLPPCPDCGHTSRDDQGKACIAIVDRRGRQEHCGCTTLAWPAHVEPTVMSGDPRR